MKAADESDEPEKHPRLGQLFMFAERHEMITFVSGLVCTAAGGFLWPVPYILMGESFGGSNVANLGYYSRLFWQVR